MRISPAEAYEKMTKEGFTYVDVRRPDEFAAGHPKDALNIPTGDTFVAEMNKRFPKDAKLILGCRTGNRSLKAQNALIADGFTNVLEQRAGWDGAKGQFGETVEEGWKKLGLPSE